MEYELTDSDGNVKKEGSKKRGKQRKDMKSDKVSEVHVSHE